MDPGFQHEKHLSSGSGDATSTLDGSTYCNKGIHLGEISDFWKRYDRLADSHDHKMSKNLNANLDVLLIFAGLFSAINTAFITFTMPALSSDPATETNDLLRILIQGGVNNSNTLSALSQSEPFTPAPFDVAVNCLLYASLSCSLIASMGVMLSKEWLQSFDRTGQTGAIEDQGRIRQLKFDGAKRWRLEEIIDFLPNIVLLSVNLFFIGLGLFLLKVNPIVAFIVASFAGFGGIVAWMSCFASTLFPYCPYETATSRLVIRLARVWINFWRSLRRTLRKVVEPKSTGEEVETASQTLGIQPGPRPTPTAIASFGLELGLNFAGHVSVNELFYDDVAEKKKDHEREVANAQAALWLLEVTSSREDQSIAIRFLSTAPKVACDAAMTSSERRSLILQLTLETVDFWRNEPGKETQEAVEHFARALCRVLPRAGNNGDWRELTDLVQSRKRGLGIKLLRELSLSAREFTSIEQHPGNSETEKQREEYLLQCALLRAIVSTRDIPVDTFQWTHLQFLIRNQDHDHSLLGLWAMLMWKGFGASDKHCRKPRTFHRRESDDTDFPDSLACAVPAFKSIAHQARSDTSALTMLDAVDIYSACIEKTTQLLRYLDRSYRERAVDATLDMLDYFRQSAFPDPGEKQMLDFFISSLELLHSVHSIGLVSSKRKASRTDLEGIWYAIDSLTTAIGESTESSGRTARTVEYLVHKTLEWISDRLQAEFGVYPPMAGLEVHPRTVGYIVSRIHEETDQRFTYLAYKNRARWFTQASSSLRDVWMDAGFSSHLIEALKQPSSPEKSGYLVRILENVCEMSPDWRRRLVADGVLSAIANAILRIDTLRDDKALRWKHIQARMLRTLLFVWNHRSNSPEIRWPTKEILDMLNPASSAIQMLLTKRNQENSSFPDIQLDMNAVRILQDDLVPFFKWESGGYKEVVSHSYSRRKYRPVPAVPFLVAHVPEIVISRNFYSA
ncbi:hypothetical protein FRB90_012606 [Tulasnella sp. 427]|nr:hypothetical protein FRB90_012606 [Tulasnella sp. 427]